jgi:hypothetical protein
MLLVIHIIIALASLTYAAYLVIRPSHGGLRSSYGLVALTLVTGTALVITKPAHLMQSCTMGLVYLGVMYTAILVARHRLARG